MVIDPDKIKLEMGAISQESDYYRTRYKFDLRRDRIWKEICCFLQKRYIPVNSRILDLGAGYCHFINNIRGSHKCAIDLSKNILKYADLDVTCYTGSCAKMENFDNASFDVVFLSNLFEHLTYEELASTVQEVKRILRSGGRLVIIQPNFKYCYREYFDDYTHRQIFTHVGLRDLLIASGFGIIKILPKFLPFSMDARIPKLPCLVKFYLYSPFKPFAGQMLIVLEKI